MEPVFDPVPAAAEVQSEPFTEWPELECRARPKARPSTRRRVGKAITRIMEFGSLGPEAASHLEGSPGRQAMPRQGERELIAGETIVGVVRPQTQFRLGVA